VNAIFRIGDHLVARFPLQMADVGKTRQLLEREAAAAAELAGCSRVRTPEPVAIGEPGAHYPLPWSVMTWLPGTVATEVDTSSSTDLARDLARFIADIRQLDKRNRRFRPGGRGGDLRAHERWVETCFQRSSGLLDVQTLRRVWDELRNLPRDADDVVTHGDLIPGNVLLSTLRLAGVLDVGGLGPADPALDLVCAWHFFDDAARHALRQELGCDDLQWERGKAWAFEQAIGLVWYYLESNRAMSVMGRRTLLRILQDRSCSGRLP